MKSRVLIFPLDREAVNIAERFNIGKNYAEYVKNLDERYEIDFTSRDIDQLSINFNYLCINNYKQFVKFKRFCENVGAGKVLDYDLAQWRNYLVTKASSNKYLSNVYGKIETLSRDADLISGILADEGDGEEQLISRITYIIMLLVDNKYQGHIFAWEDGNYLMLLGIRKRIDIEFLPANEQIGVARYLFEGARQLATYIQKDKLVVPFPLDAMRPILPKLGFNTVKRNDSGPGFVENVNFKGTILPPDAERCYDCYISDRSDKPFIGIDNLTIIIPF